MRDQPSIPGAGKIYARRQLKTIAARWDARAKTWDEALADADCHLNEDDAYCRFTRVVQRLIAKRRRFCATHGVIDAGCGTGLVLGEVISSFSWGMGVDISPKMVRAARAKRIASARFVVGDCFDLPSLCPEAGAVISRGVLLSHYGRKQGLVFLRAARSVLAPGGFLVFDFLNETARTKYSHMPENKTWFSGEEIESMARRAGLSTVKILGKPNRRVLLLMGEMR
jgi:predicted TPR repeat methyltransferase